MKFTLVGGIFLLFSTVYGQDVLNESISTNHSSSSNSNIRVSSATGETVYVGGSNAEITIVEGSIQPHLLLNIGTIEIKDVVDVTIYPNPTSDKIYISKTNTMEFRGEVIDANGKRLQQFTLTDLLEIDFSPYALGHYSIVLMDVKNNQKNTYNIILPPLLERITSLLVKLRVCNSLVEELSPSKPVFSAYNA